MVRFGCGVGTLGATLTLRGSYQVDAHPPVPGIFMKRVPIFAFAFCFLSFQPFGSVQTASHAAQQPRKTDYEFMISGSHWTDTGLALSPGDRIHIYGGIQTCAGPFPNEKEHLPDPKAPPGALLAKLQPEEPPVVASPDADMPIVDASELYLGMNCAVMTGKTPVRVHVTWHKEGK